MSWVRSPLVPTIPRNRTPEYADDSTDFFEIDPSNYPRVYLGLKAQRTILETLNQEVPKLRSSVPKDDLEHLDYIGFLIESLLGGDFGAVFPLATNSIPAIRELLNTNRPSPPVRRLASNVLSASISLSRVFSFVSCTLPTTAVESPPSSNRPPPPTSTEDHNSVLVLCRICEEYVPIEMIEAHSKSCAIAYRSEFTMLSSNDRIKRLQSAIRNSILNSKWPGAQQYTVEVLLPVLHATMLLDETMRLKSAEDIEKLKLISASIAKVSVPQTSPNAFSLLAKAKELVYEKLSASSEYNQAAQQMTRVTGTVPLFSPTTIADFEFIKRISSGAFARVFLAKKKKTGDIYAIKVTPKADIRQKNQMKQILTEKDILLQNTNPYIVNFYYSIVGEHNFYLVMEFLPGGDLFSLLHHVGCLEERYAKVYAAQIVKALEYLHDNGIVHRDLKPDNILVTSTGTLKLTDFGLSLYGAVDRRISTGGVVTGILGTPDYLAPELILSQPHSYSADYWSLGVVIFEFLTGVPPFHSDTENTTFAQILTRTMDWSLIKDCSDEVKSLIDGLLNLDPSKRLGSRGIGEIMEHSWFHGIDFDHLEELEPPFVPDVGSGTSTDYFTERYQFESGSEADILSDIEIAKTSQPRSVSFSNLSGRCSFASRAESAEEEDEEDEINQFPSIALQNLSQSNAIAAMKIKPTRSSSVAEDLHKLGEELGPSDKLSASKSFQAMQEYNKSDSSLQSRQGTSFDSEKSSSSGRKLIRSSDSTPDLRKKLPHDMVDVAKHTKECGTDT